MGRGSPRSLVHVAHQAHLSASLRAHGFVLIGRPGGNSGANWMASAGTRTHFHNPSDVGCDAEMVLEISSHSDYSARRLAYHVRPSMPSLQPLGSSTYQNLDLIHRDDRRDRRRGARRVGYGWPQMERAGRERVEAGKGMTFQVLHLCRVC